jgi:uronate dehydrogenase
MAIADQTWVMTGAAGVIARSLRAGLAPLVGRLRLLDLLPIEPLHDREEPAVVDLRDQAAVESALAGAHGVLHLGGIADEADLHDLADVNIVGTYHVVESARRTGVPRVVYASSNRVTGFYDATTTVDVDMPNRPDGVYGVSKIACEALGRLYVDKFGLEFVSVRIGSFEELPQDARQLSTWLSPADCVRAFQAAMTAPDVTYAAFYAVSRNARLWWDLEAGHRLGFDPQDDAERSASDQVRAQPALVGPQGGPYASAEFTLDRQR